MQQLTIIIHILAAMAIIALILMQRGKGSDVGAAFGSGASQTMFGSKGSFPFLCKVIGILAGIFFITSIALNYFNANMVKKNNENDLSISVTETEKKPDVPAVAEVKSQSIAQKEKEADEPAKNVPKN